MQRLFGEKHKRAEERRKALEAQCKKEGKKYNRSMPVPMTDADRAWETSLWTQVVALLTPLREKHPKSTDVTYNLACALAMTGQADAAMAALQQSYENGWLDAHHLQQDDDLLSLRAREDFQALAKTMATTIFEVTPATGFRGAVGWAPGGRPVPPGKGPRYLLSTMLAVTSGRGNSVSEALAYLRRSAAADATCPTGTIYILENNDIRSLTRAWAFHTTVETLKRMGLHAEILKGVLPQDKDDVAGLVAGSAGFDWAKSKSAILPGAICEHLTSCGGMMAENAGQTPLIEFLRYGAAGASGTVHEPYALQWKFPMPLIQVFYASGCSLAEAFYQSVSGPYQLLIVGDPLCQPWARRPAFTCAAPAPQARVTGTIAIRPAATEPQEVPLGAFEIFLAGRRVHVMKPGESFALDTTKLPDGHYELRIVGVAANARQTQQRLVIPFVVQNRATTLVVKDAPPTAVRYDETVRIGLAADGAQQIRVLHNGRVLGEIQGAAGEIAFPANRLGQGPVRLQPLAVLDPKGPKILLGPPLDITVDPAPASALETPPPAESLKPGLRLTIGADKAYVLPRLGVPVPEWKADSAYVIESYFETPTDDVYQFQIRAGTPISAMTVDGRALGAVPTDAWAFLPTHLGAGWHKLEIRGTAERPPRLDIRFGGPGAHTVTGKTFRCLRLGNETEIPDPRDKPKAPPAPAKDDQKPAAP